MVWSPARPGQRAEISPSGTATSTAMMSAAVTSSSEAGAAVPRSDRTGRWVWIDRPQFPVRMPPKYDASCTAGGRSRPRNRRASATCAAEACGPAHVAAGSPGTTRAITNVRTMTPATTRIAVATRRATKTINCRRA